MVLFPFFETMSEKHIFSWAQQNSPTSNDYAILKELLELTDDEVVFIVAARQDDSFHHMIKEYDLDDYIAYDQGKFIHNPNYMDSGPRIKMYILKGKGEHYEY